MQQLSRTCMIADHYSKAIDYVCIYPECNLSRFLCSKCLIGTSHRHNQQEYSHVLDNGDFYDKMKIKIDKAKINQQEKKYDIENSFVHLKQIIQEVQNLIKNVENIIQDVTQGNLWIFNINDLDNMENQLLNVQQHGFSRINDLSLNNLINLEDLFQNKHIYKQLQVQANLIISNAEKIKLWRLSQVGFNEKLKQNIIERDYQLQQIDKKAANICIHSTAISNDSKYIALGRDDGLLKIWDHLNNNLIKSIKLWGPICGCKFTDDDTFLYVGSDLIYQLDVKNQFEKLYEKSIHVNYITNIICISNTIVLTSSVDKSVVKTDIKRKKQLFQIFETEFIFGLDYNKILNVIATGSNDYSIKLWNGEEGTLLIEKLNAHNNFSINQVLFILNNNQLISLDSQSNLIIWNINYETKQLEQQQLIPNYGLNISLVQQQKYIIAIGQNWIKIHSIKGEVVREIDHEVLHVRSYNSIQSDSMNVLLILGLYTVWVCKLDVE